MTSLFDLISVNPFWVWAAIGALLLALEVSTGSGWLLWPAASAATVAVMTLVLDDVVWIGQVGLFAALTIATTLLAQKLWPARPAADAHDINDNVARLMGHHGRAVANFQGRDGRVFVDGKEWAAELDDDALLKAGDPVEVIGLSGARLRVRPSR